MKEIFKKIITASLRFEAKLVLKKYKPKVVVVTGSVGKTSTKDAIYTVLATTFSVRKTSKSFNAEIGVPLTILGLPNAWNDPKAWLKNLLDGFLLLLVPHKYPEWLVIEVGADKPGDIASVAKWLHPEVAVVTRLSDVPVHVEFFASAEQVRYEKSQFVLASTKKTTVILNGDDKLVSSMRPLAQGRVLTYGSTMPADVSGNNFKNNFSAGISYLASTKNQKAPVVVEGVLGRQHMYTTLAALAVAEALGIDLVNAAAALKNNDSPPGRMKILRGIRDSWIIDDTYNSSPIAASEALDTLKQLQPTTGRKIAVLGDMLELGTHSPAEHDRLGCKAAASGANQIYTVGSRAQGIFSSARAAGFSTENLFCFHDSAEAAVALAQNVGPGDIVLVKGSQGIRMEKIVEKIMAEPWRASELLVRQETEWKRR